MRNDAELTAVEKRELIDAIVDVVRKQGLSTDYSSGQSKQWAYDRLADELDRMGYEIRRRD